tara:strand:- start:1147 stop:1296 length:150 start_codon:yes stop_codon:yes gene_type:complete
LFEFVADTQQVKQADRCQKPDQMAEENHQNADMKQHRANHQLPTSQQLT